MSKTKKKTGKTATRYVLVDFENVQPKNLGLLEGRGFKVFVFVGANQTKVPLDMVKVLQRFGGDGRYIEITGSGRNALDFHIAFYLGELAAADPGASFHVISRDKGFDPLMKHLKAEKGVRAQRSNDIAEIPSLRISKTSNLDTQIDSIVSNLRARGQSRPRKLVTLQNTINNLVSEELGERELDALVDELRKRKLIVVTQGKVQYKLGGRRR